ncbi:ABC transporter permease [Rhizobium sophoriradicis]|uniref:ABC transporter permease n=1 Tax=Rhizobium sophoriradicis TaxID=1535245 RepID=UPI000BBD5DCB|nr:ABC-2 family transporter protein [Rhizobium sophoriradicis]PCK86608.1 ABC transporter permease [Rhizobium sophoriradicis]
MQQTLALAWYLMRLRMRTRLQYRVALALAWVSQGFGYAGAFASLWIILTRFGGMGGWRWQDMALLLGFHTLGYALGACFTFVQLRRMEEMVRDGEFDTLLIRPINTWAFLSFSGFNIEYGSHVILGVGLMAWALPKVAIDWGMLTILQLVASIFSAALLTGAVITLIGATALVVRRARYLFGIYFDFWELSRYPITIFAAPLQFLLLSGLPFAYMAYVPVAALIGKPVPYLGDAAAPVAVAVGPIAALIAAAFWRFAIRRYQRAGG